MKNVCVALLFSSAVIISSSAYAEGQGGPHGACKDDVQSFCSNVQPGGGRIINCLQEHYKEISDNCYAALGKMHARQQARQNNGVPPQQGSSSSQGDNMNPPPPPPPQGNNASPPPPPPQGSSNELPLPPEGTGNNDGQTSN